MREYITGKAKMTYTYDSMYRMASAACTTDTGLNLSASYTYSNDLLTAIQTPSTTYGFTYGDFDLRTSVSAGSYTLAEYTYTNDKNRYLSALDYGNGDSVQYTYDDHGRLVTQTYEDGDSLYHKYDNSGNLASVWDSATARTTYYYYDLTDRMMKYVEKGDDGYSHSVGYEYDKLNNLTQQVETINGVDHTTSYGYDKDNRITSVTADGTTVEYTYDTLGRVSQKLTKRNGTTYKTENYTYTSPSSGKTSSQVATYNIVFDIYNVTYSYTYDDNGNILSISDGSKTTSYVYDSANQLIRENNQAEGYTHTWEYDAAGNILNRKEYAYTTGELGTPTDTANYSYHDTQWGDLLTGYDSNDVRNDELGNVTEDGSWRYTWEHGRQLSIMDGIKRWSFEYDANGMRTQRTNGTTTYTYIYNGSQLTRMTVGDEVFDFTYDADGTPLTVTWNGNLYYYVTNLQGDVIRILDADGRDVATYTYDAWGVITQCGGCDQIELYNPLCYRGYVYDIETGLYYLQSRYYNPELGRFISADGQISSVGGEMLGYNQFAYCFNNPVNMSDDSGNWPNWRKLCSGAGLLAVGIMACAAAATVVSGGACAPLLVAACVTFAAGGMTILNGTAEMVESVTNYNYMRDGVYGGDSRFYEGQKKVFATAAEVGTAALGVVSGSPNVCFIAGTMVLVLEGTKAIETIEEGDYVWAWDENTGNVELKPVVETYVNETTELIHVFVDGEEIITTPSHPFYSPVKGWTDAAQLRAGDILVLVNGEYVVVEKIQHEILETPITVYNFQVADYHTYYVSGTGILVHNSRNHNSKWNKERRTYWKSKSQTALEYQDYGSYIATPDNINRMSKGLAPIGWDGFSVQLHHWQGIANNFYDYSPITRTLHQIIHLFE